MDKHVFWYLYNLKTKGWTDACRKISNFSDKKTSDRLLASVFFIMLKNVGIVIGINLNSTIYGIFNKKNSSYVTPEFTLTNRNEFQTIC